MSVKIIIADDHDIIREGIKGILQNKEEYLVIAEASDGEEVVSKVSEFKPDVLLLDISMPKRSGLDVLSQIHNIAPNTKVIIVTMHRANIYVDKSFNLNVMGYLNKENVVEDLLPALRAVIRGEKYISSKISQYLVERSAQKEKRSKSAIELTQREKDIVRLVVEGKTAKEIAETLFISSRTVENYKNSLLKKLGLNKTSELIKYAITHKIVEVQD